MFVGGDLSRLRCLHGCNRPLHIGKQLTSTSQKMQICHAIARVRLPEHKRAVLHLLPNLLPGCADCNGICHTRNAYDFAKESVAAGPGYPLKRNKLWKALRIIHREWVRNTLVPTQDSDDSDDSDDFEPEQSHPQPDLDLTEDIRILYTQNTDRD